VLFRKSSSVGKVRLVENLEILNKGNEQFLFFRQPVTVDTKQISRSKEKDTSAYHI
jgi:hypothetical protein